MIKINKTNNIKTVTLLRYHRFTLLEGSMTDYWGLQWTQHHSGFQELLKHLQISPTCQYIPQNASEICCYLYTVYQQYCQVANSCKQTGCKTPLENIKSTSTSLVQLISRERGLPCFVRPYLREQLTTTRRDMALDVALRYVDTLTF